MATIANLLVKIGADSKGLQSGMAAAQSAASKFGSGVVSAGKTAVKATAGVAAAFTGVAVAIGTKALSEVADFQKGMNEVYTLMPGMSEAAMKSMENDVKSFSKKFGTLPNEVIPALYQSISAGVPENNVFEFLEVAQKAAIGGVAELETAVDGISTVVNSYGSEVIDASKASDLMFTAVKLGKTDFNQLSNSLYNVLPTAASLGVGFEDITAAMASMTAQGTPTSVATTQLRQMLNELAKDGGKTAGFFEDMAGQTFPEFIASGGDVAGALAYMEKAALENEVRMSDLFSSVDAGNAALALSGDNAAGYAKNLAEMGAAAGATDAAFDQMNQGILVSLNKIKANAITAFIDIGDALAPAAEDVLGGFLDILTGEEGGAERMAEGAKNLIETFINGAVSKLPEVIEVGLGIMSGLIDAIVDNREGIMDAIVMVIEGLAQAILDNAQVAFSAFFDLMWRLIYVAIDLLPEFLSLGLKIILNAILGIMKNAPLIIKKLTGIIFDLADLFMKYLPLFLSAGIKIIVMLIQGLANMAPKLIPMAVDLIMKLVTTLLNNLDSIIRAAVQIIVALVIGLTNAIPVLLRYLPEIMNTIVRVLIANLPLLVKAAFQIIIALAGGLISAIPQLVLAIPQLIGAIANGFKNTDWKSIGRDIIRGIVTGIKNAGGLIKDAAKNAAKSAFDSAKKFLGIGSPSKLFKAEIGYNVGTGMVKGLEDTESMVSKATENVMPEPKVPAVDVGGVSGRSTGGGDYALLRELIDLIRRIEDDDDERMNELIQAIRDIRLSGAIEIDGRRIGDVVLDPLLDAARLRRREWPVNA